MLLKCEHCGETFVDDKNITSNYLTHQSMYHKDKAVIEEEIFGDFRKKMIKQKNDYEALKKKTGDSDLVFNSKERDARSPDKI